MDGMRKFQVREESDGSFSIVYHLDTPGQETLVYATRATHKDRIMVEEMANLAESCNIQPPVDDQKYWLLIDKN